MMDIGSAFAIAGNPKYVNIGNGQGVSVGVSGTLTAQQTTDFVVQIWDVTAQYPSSPTAAVASPIKVLAQRSVASQHDSLMPEDAILVSSTPATAVPVLHPAHAVRRVA